MTPVSTLAGPGLRLAAEVRLLTTRATALLRTRLRGVHEFMSTPDD